MRSLRSSALALATAGALAPLACASVLGDFSTGPAASQDGGNGPDGAAATGKDGATGPESGGGSDASSPETSTPPDAGSQDAGEDAPPISLLNCNTWQNKNPALLLTVENDAGGSSSSIGQVYVENLPTLGAARVIVGQNNPTTQVVVYTVDENFQQMNPPFVQTTMPSAGLRGELHETGDVALLVQPFNTNQFEYVAVDDTDSTPDVSDPSPVAVANPPADQAMGGNNQFRSSSVSLGTHDYETLASYTANIDGGQTGAALSYWISGEMGWRSLYSGPSSGALTAGTPLFVSGQSVYGFFSPAGMTNNNGPTTLNEFSFSDGTGATLSAPRAVTGPGGMADLLAAASVGSGGAELAFVELVGAQGGDIRLGIVPAAKLGSFMVDDLNVLGLKPASNDAGFFDTTPFSNQNSGPGARWMSNGEFGVMGGGGVGGQSNSTGINFYVATADGRWLVETAGTGSNVLSGQSIVSSSFDYSSGFTQIIRQYDVAWIVQGSDGSMSLYFNVLICQ